MRMYEAVGIHRYVLYIQLHLKLVHVKHRGGLVVLV